MVHMASAARLAIGFELELKSSFQSTADVERFVASFHAALDTGALCFAADVALETELLFHQSRKVDWLEFVIWVLHCRTHRPGGARQVCHLAIDSRFEWAAHCRTESADLCCLSACLAGAAVPVTLREIDRAIT